MTAATWAAACFAGVAAALLLPAPARPSASVRPVVAPARRPTTGPSRWRPVWCLLAAGGVAAVVGGTVGLLAAPVAAVAAWVVLGRSEPGAVRREREAVARDLPHLVELLAATLRSGADPADGLATACAALQGPAAARLDAVRARLRLGVPPAEVWDTLGEDPQLAPLGRALARSHTSGASVVATVGRLADELEREARAAVEDRARAVGVKAAVPLGLCLLPAFLLLGIVPTVAALLGSLAP